MHTPATCKYITMPGTQPGADGQCSGAIALGSGCGSAKQLIGDARHGADHDNGPLAGGDPTRDDGGCTVNGGRIFDPN